MGKQQGDWKSQLGAIKADMRANMTPEELQKEKIEREKEIARKHRFERTIPGLYLFLAFYKQNSGIFINNFFRDRDYDTYCADKFHIFDFDVTGIMPPNHFDDLAFSWAAIGALRELEEAKCAYYPINMDLMRMMEMLADGFDNAPRFEYDTVVYRGCSTIERNGVNGIVSTTCDKEIAEQFSRGTVLTIHVPAGTPYIDIKQIRPKEQRKDDIEKEILLPPCDFEVISSKVTKKGCEPNNLTGKTIHLEIKVKPLDLLESFLYRMENPPKFFEENGLVESSSYAEALMFMRELVEKRQARKNKNKMYEKNRSN